MHHFLEWVKHHPWLAGISVVGLLVIYRIFSGSGSSGATSSGPSNAQIQADAALQAAQLQANTQLALGGLSAGVASQQISAQQNIAGQQISAGVTNTTTAGNVQLGVAQLQADVANTSTNATLQSSLAQTSALRDIALAPYQLAEDQLNSTANSTLTALEGQVHALADNTAAGFADLNTWSQSAFGYSISPVFPGGTPNYEQPGGAPTLSTPIPVTSYNLGNIQPAAHA